MHILRDADMLLSEHHLVFISNRQCLVFCIHNTCSLRDCWRCHFQASYLSRPFVYKNISLVYNLWREINLTYSLIMNSPEDGDSPSLTWCLINVLCLCQPLSLWQLVAFIWGQGLFHGILLGWMCDTSLTRLSCPVLGTKAQMILTELCLEDMRYSNEALTERDFLMLDV